MYLRKLSLLAAAVLLLSSGAAFAVPKIVSNTVNGTEHVIKKTAHGTMLMLKQHVKHPFYFGGSAGYGSTDWSEITTTPSTLAQVNLAAETAPIGAKDDGFAWGGFIGYQFSKHFTVEGVYTRYHSTVVSFQTDITPNLYGIEQFRTNTHSYSLLGKIMVPFGFTNVYVYADAGVTYVHRDDKKVTGDPNNPPVDFDKRHKGHWGPSFGFGLAYNITEHLFTEGSFQYTTGYGKADIKPAEDYIPFVYSLMLSLGVRV
jgi:opacity protein-like surface antigen